VSARSPRRRSAGSGQRCQRLPALPDRVRRPCAGRGTGNRSGRIASGKGRLRPYPEASRTASLLLQRLKGETKDADAKDSPQPDPLSGRGKVTIAAPTWLPEPDTEQRIEFGSCGHDVPYEPWEDLLPNRLDQTASGAARRIGQELMQLREDSNALLVVGHQPQMGWLSSYLSGDRRPGWRSGAVPLAASEVVCLRLRDKDGQWRGRLRWTLAPDDSKALDAVSDKVKGKMESAKLLSAVITLALTALLGVLLDSSRWSGLGSPKASIGNFSYGGQAAIQVAFVLLLTALALYLLTMYSYDSLLMPTRFWAEDPDRSREDGPDASQRRSALTRLVERRTR
jgi:hypothetical protein